MAVAPGLRVRVGLAAAHLRVLCFDLPLRGLLLSLLLLLLCLLALLVCSSLLVPTLAVESLSTVRFAFADSLVRFHSVSVNHFTTGAWVSGIAVLIPMVYMILIVRQKFHAGF